LFCPVLSYCCCLCSFWLCNWAIRCWAQHVNK
jgi:hypothetical protein